MDQAHIATSFMLKVQKKLSDCLFNVQFTSPFFSSSSFFPGCVLYYENKDEEFLFLSALIFFQH